MDILEQYTPGTIQIVVTTFLTASSVFNEPGDEVNVLEQIFCFAIREALLDEIEGVERSAQAQLDHVLGRLDSSVPEHLKRVFRQLTPTAFGEWYRLLRQQADALGVDPSEYADGLRIAKQVTSAVARRR